jgi:hypothetical protein
MENTTFNQICANQADWAREQGIQIDNGYTRKLEDNLFDPPLLKETVEEFMKGKGSEFGMNGERGKMQALHSSSALVVNCFEYWRKAKNIKIIAALCGASDNLNKMKFEATHTNPVGRIPPHLDLEFFSCSGDIPLTIESKFTEVYHRKTRRQLSPTYIKKKEVWENIPGCEKLAQLIDKERKGLSSFQYLDAPQLLKHILGLERDYERQGFTLLYLWYEVYSQEAEKHRQEIEVFQSYVKNEIDFRVSTYQELFLKVSKIQGIDQSYLNYLKMRYFK